MLPSVSTARDPAATSGSGGGGIGRKNRKGRKILLWLLAIVVIVVVVMMVEDETELQHADDLVVSKTLPLRHSSHSKSNRARDDEGGSTNQEDEEGGALGAMYGLPDSTEGHDGELGPSQQQLRQQQQQRLYDKRNRDTEMVRNVKMNGMDDDLFEYFRNSRAGNNKAGRNGNNELDLRLKKKTKSSSSASSSTQKKRKRRKKKRNGKKKLQPFPVIRYDDDNIPQGAAGSIVHAADALLCRESVIDYVINATDLKDECDGLKKAFTKTCADDQSEQQPQHNEDVGGGPGRRRRLLAKDGIDDSFSSTFFSFTGATTTTTKKPNPVMEWQYKLHRWSRYIRRQSTNFVESMTRSRSDDLLMAEDEVLEEWENAFEEVQNGWDWRNRYDEIQFLLDWVVKEEVSDDGDEDYVNGTRISSDGTFGHSIPQQQRNLREERKAATSDGRNTKALDHKDSDSPSSPSSLSSSQGETAANTTAHTADHRPKDFPKENSKHSNMANLALPTSMKHVSEKLLSEALMLQQDNKLKNAFHNQTNHTVSEAQADAAASSKAVSDANDIVSSVLNDPTSVEARTCCTSILNVFHENCNYEPEEELSDSRLFVVILIIAVCGLVKSLIRHFTIRWLPEAAGCILVGVSAGYFLTFYPHHDISFDGKWFLRIMVPPIVFEAALSIDKRSFHRHVVPILFYAIVGTLLASAVTAVVVHEGSAYFHGLCETIPYAEALTFGALISSIDPIAVLSVLSNMGMSDVDTIYVVIFGESLLNDGVAIVFFETLVHFLDDNMEVDSHAVSAAAIHFLVVFIGSFLIGIASGLCCTVYYWAMHGCQTPLVEVLMFCCWALFPYYVCDGIEWSGIVSVVAAGFVMDIFVVGTHFGHDSLFFERDLSGNDSDIALNDSVSEVSEKGPKDRRRRSTLVRRPIFSRDGHLSTEAKTHIGFVTEIIATMMETAIFAYLGLFLFSSRYHWNFYHVFIAIAGCCIGRAVMILSLSLLANWITRIQQFQERKRQRVASQSPETHGALEIRKVPGVIIDQKMQLVLWFAGLRGAMSFALVEDIPLYDAVTGEGTRLKSELKAMTSASIIFTVFILGGGTYYMMEYLGLAPTQQQRKDHDINSPSMLAREMEMIGLLSRSQSALQHEKNDDSGEESPQLTSTTQTLSDEDEYSHDVYSAGSHSTYESHAGTSPRMKTGRPGTFRRQRQAKR